jgi:hypothetical protein
MTPDTGTAILVLGVFVLPGFITLVFREWLYAVKREESAFERLLHALFNSAIIYALGIAGGLVFGLDKEDVEGFYRGDKSLSEDFVAAVLLFLVLPASLAIVGSYWKGSRRFRPLVLRLLGSSTAHSTASGWNELFSLQDSAFVRATLSDGRVIGGLYTRGSLAGYSQHTQDLYISQRWELDDQNWFVKPAPRSLGAWFPRESIVSIDVYALEEVSGDRGGD